MPDVTVTYLRSQEIDRQKWDNCINNAHNGLIYSSSIYLDMLADQWNAVVVGDYEAVMALPYRKKFFVKYHYHVPFMAQGGLIGNCSTRTLKMVAKIIFRHIRYGDLMLNFGNREYARLLKAVPVVNMVLDLSVQFPHIHKLYHNDLDKNLRRASRYELTFDTGNDVKQAIELFKKQYASRLPSVRSLDFERFTGLCLHLQKVGNAFIRKVSDSKGKLLAIGLFLVDQKRIYNIMNTVLPDGRRKSANHFLFDQLLREYADTGMLMDFEGSQVPGIRKFYANFGAVNEPYFWHRRYPLRLDKF